MPPQPPGLIDLPESGFTSDNLGVQTIQFRSQGDSQVCPLCDGLDGETFSIDDPDIPIIPEDTHPNCRCFYQDAQLGGEVDV